MKYAHMECYNFISKKCSQEGIEHIGEDWTSNESCVTSSFEGAGRSGNNTVLAEHSARWIELGTMYWPMVTLNNATFRGDITPENILEDICANLYEKP